MSGQDRELQLLCPWAHSQEGKAGAGFACAPSSWSPAHLPLSFQSQHFDGLVVEVWNQLLVQKHA